MVMLYIGAVIGFLIGWLAAAAFTCGKIADLERVIDDQRDRIIELRASLRQEMAR